MSIHDDMYEMNKRLIENDFGISPAEKYLLDMVIRNLNGLSITSNNPDDREYKVYVANTANDGSKDLDVMAIIHPDQNELIFTYNTSIPIVIRSNPPKKLFNHINYHVMNELNKRGRLQIMKGDK